MEQYISKAALAAEIEKYKKEASERLTTSIERPMRRLIKDKAWVSLCQNLLSFISTLEVKEVDLEKDVRQILSLYYEGIKHYEDIIKEEREENGGSDLAIKIMDGVVDARELSIQYVLDKLKAQKG